VIRPRPGVDSAVLAQVFRADADARSHLVALQRGPGMALTADTPSIRYLDHRGWIAARRGPQGPESRVFSTLALAFAFTEAGQ
jgi:hypothetical protein